MLESFSKINQHLKAIQDNLTVTMKTEALSEVMGSLKSHVESFFADNFKLENAYLRQITRKEDRTSQSLLSDLPNSDLVRHADHIQEARETMENFLDYKREYYVHQISVCPKEHGVGNYSELTFVVHIINKYQSQENLRDLRDLSTSLNTTNLGLSSRLTLTEKKYLDDDTKHNLAYYFKGLLPILRQTLAISADL